MLKYKANYALNYVNGNRALLNPEFNKDEMAQIAVCEFHLHGYVVVCPPPNKERLFSFLLTPSFSVLSSTLNFLNSNIMESC